MKEKLKCFVIIGYGKKTSYADGKLRELDLDETYNLLIKPVFDELEIECYRAIDKNLSGSIDKVMLQEIQHADIALADLTTLNANVMWELGVRHALKPHDTIMICDSAQMAYLPFDINHFPVHQYTHSIKGIPYKEVDRFRKHLRNVVQGILDQDPHEIDSPVYTFLDIESGKSSIQKVVKLNPVPESDESFASILEKAERAKESKEYEKALEFYATAKLYASQNMTLKDNLPLIVTRQALCTYKSKEPSELEALKNAQAILAELKPMLSQDTEVLGLSGAINKRLYEITNDESYLNSSINFYEKGYTLKQDYYNGINLAFMLYLKTNLLRKEDKGREDLKVKADYIRNSVEEIALKLEADKDFDDSNDAIWVLLTLAEVYNYRNDDGNMKKYEEKANEIAIKNKDTFAMGSYHEQKDKIDKIMIDINN